MRFWIERASLLSFSINGLGELEMCMALFLWHYLPPVHAYFLGVRHREPFSLMRQRIEATLPTYGKI